MQLFQPRRRSLLVAATGLALAGATLISPPAAAPAPTSLAQRSTCTALVNNSQASTSERQADFATAARDYGVPRGVLMAVSYLESRWDHHGGAQSVSGGYGLMHLTDVRLPDQSLAKGDGSRLSPPRPESLRTLRLAADLTGLSPDQLRASAAANICGGAAVLASYQRELGLPAGERTDPGRWYAAVARYSGATDASTARRFTGDVFATLRHGEARVADGGARVRLPARADLRPRVGQLAALDLLGGSGGWTNCPERLGCEWIPAPYEWYGKPDPFAYGNHDLARRPRDMNIDYIVIHDTETSYRDTLALVQNPEYVSWQYTLRSSDGHIAQHVRPKNVAWHAGNWYFNMHSIGLEHEGYAAQNGEWYTEAMYRTSARLVRYLTNQFDIPRDRAHIIGHDEIPGPAPEYVAGMHWDPGPFWDWEHYFELLRRPIQRNADNPTGLRVVVPGFEGNKQPLTDCATGGEAETPAPCRGDTNFVTLRQFPSHFAPLVADAGLHPDGGPSTTSVSDIGARAAAGHEFAVAGRTGNWTAMWYLGDIAWFHDPKGARNSKRIRGWQVTARPGSESVPVYGRAYPEESAYP
nr:N-acetylmuramoyl-L-alanine amidase [Nocardioidaceae bacterium]